MQAVFPPLRVVAMAGSLGAASYNRGLLRAAQDLTLTGLTIKICNLAAIPLYNADMEVLEDPPPVAALKSAVKKADALLIAVAEYNYGVSGVLKNTIDWLSRPPDLVLRGKPVALLGASAGMAGTARAQLQLRRAFVSTQTAVMPPPPEVLVSNAQEKFDARGELIDDETRAHLRQLLEALVTWTQRVAPATDTKLAASR